MKVFGAPFQCAIASFQEMDQIAAADSFSNNALVKFPSDHNKTPPYIICIRTLEESHPKRSAIVLLLLSEVSVK